jgi:predicted nucleic acid-binding protein
MRIFLDTSLLSDAKLSRVVELVLDRYIKGDKFFVSSITHFQLEWGYSIANKSSEKYRKFLRDFRVEVVPFTKSDAEEAAKTKPVESDILDSLIAATVRKLDGVLWSADRDFFRFLPKSKVQIFGS